MDFVRHGRIAAAWLVALFAIADAAGQDLTWQEANRRSAESIQQKGHTTEAADLAKAAFDLYAVQSKSYNPRNHAQLLLNLLDVRLRASGLKRALRELDDGVTAIAQRHNPDDLLFIDVWKEAARVSRSGGDEDSASRYYERAIAAADKAWGESSERAIGLRLLWISDLREKRGYRWARDKYQWARDLAVRASDGGKLLDAIELSLAKLEIERQSWPAAIDLYRTLIERLEARNDPSQERILQMAYGQLEYAYEENGDKPAAEEVRQRRNRSINDEQGKLEPLAKQTPVYPRAAAHQRIEGAVVLVIAVTPEGTVSDVRVAESRPPGVFDEAAIDAIRKWKFKPRIIDGKAVAQEGLQTIEFKCVK